TSSLVRVTVHPKSHYITIHDAIPCGGDAKQKTQCRRARKVGCTAEAAMRGIERLVEMFKPRLECFSGRFNQRDVGRRIRSADIRSEEHTSELQSRENLVCRLLLE